MRIELSDIRKTYGNVTANDKVSLTFSSGGIHGLLGENGAGKSTLMKILAGYTRKTSGEVRIDGAPVDFDTPESASRAGVGMLYQEPLDFPAMTVLENLMTGLSNGLVLHKKRHAARFTSLCRRFGFSLDLGQRVETLTVGERQQLEIVRLLAGGVRALILDEPTTGISGEQKEKLFTALRKLADTGNTVILVSHKLEDVMALCHSAAVLQAGRVAGSMERPFDRDRLVKLMFGAVPEPPSATGRPGEREVLSVDNVSAGGGRLGLTDASLKVREGEVVGLAGLEGSGQGVLLRVCAGLVPPTRGVVTVNGRVMNRKSHPEFKARKVAFVPASRMEEGLAPDMTISEHLALLDKKRRFFIRPGAFDDRALEKIGAFSIRGRPQSRARELSGGNQQRLLLSLLPENPRLLLLDNPTRGLDIESAQMVWAHLTAFRKAGCAVVFSSPELDEILSVASRVVVFHNGRIVMDVPVREVDVSLIGRKIAGAA